jgi:RNA polymerase-binding transcription factor DksA
MWNLESDWAEEKLKSGYKKIGENDFLVPWKTKEGEVLVERYYHHFTQDELKRLIKDSGFKIEEMYFESKGKRVSEKEGQKVSGDWQGTAQGFSGKQSDEMDVADTMEELAINVPLVETLEARLKDVALALAHMKTGQYGLDEMTGEPIPIERLRANPAARTTVQ